MELNYASQRMARLCSQAKSMVKELGKPCAEKLQQRLSELRAADTLNEMRSLPAARCHELAGNRKGYLAVDLKHPYRLIFQPDHDPSPLKPDGGLDWGQVTKILVIDVVDYH